MIDVMQDKEKDRVFKQVDILMKKLKSNQQLQALASKNGIDVKNTVDLTDDTVNNIAVSVVS